jgi:MFS family permease
VRNRTTILVLGTAQFLMVLDTTVMNVSISQVVADLDTTVADVQLAITAYALVMGAFMLTGAKLGDRWGRRRVFAIGIAIYGTGSLITALSPSLGVLLVGWSGIEGIGAVLVVPAIMALTANTYSGKERAVAFGILGGIAGAGAAAGPLIGGFVTSAWTWRVVFAAESVFVVGILFLVRKIKDSPPTETSRFDLGGSVLSAAGLGLVVLGILKGGEWGFLTPTGALTIGGTEITPFGFSAVPFIVLAGVVTLGVFARYEERLVRLGRVPLLQPDLLRIPQLRGGLSMYVSNFLILNGTFFVIPLYLQVVLGKDALQTGIKIFPISVAMMLAAMIGPRLAERISPRRIVQIGLGFLFAGIVLLMSSISPNLASPVFAVSLALFGGGVGLVISQLGNVVMSSVDESRSSEAGGLQGAAQNVGSSLGTALIGAILLSGLTAGFQERIVNDPSIPAPAKEQITAVTEQGIPMVPTTDVQAAGEKAGLPPQQVEAVTNHYADAQIKALKRALLFASVFALVALWFTRRLPGEPLGETSPGRSPPEGVGSPA